MFLRDLTPRMARRIALRAPPTPRTGGPRPGTVVGQGKQKSRHRPPIPKVGGLSAVDKALLHRRANEHDLGQEAIEIPPQVVENHCGDWVAIVFQIWESAA